MSLALVLSLSAGAQEIPEPERGQWANSTLALLQHSRDLCQDLGARVRDSWRQIGADDEAGIRERVLHQGMSGLASARAAGDLVRQLMGGAQREAGFEVGASLERLQGLLRSLCDTVAVPEAPRGSFESKLLDLEERIALEEEQLGRLMVIEERALAAAIEPYLTHIQLAGVQAEGELLDYLSSLIKEPEPPTLTELMVVWHGQYVHGVRPTKEALRHFLVSRKKGNVREIGQSCRDLIDKVATVLDDDALFRAPDPKVHRPLKDAYVSIRQVATQCARGRFDLVDKHLEEMQADLQAAARRLGPHGLAP